jgi:aldose 1-epimerase
MNARNPSRLCALAALAALCAAPGHSAGVSKVEKQPFGIADGRAVDLYVLTDSGGMVAKVMTYGATLTELDTPDRDGEMDDVVLGFPSLDGYLAKEPYFGATVGRVGNRIARGRLRQTTATTTCTAGSRASTRSSGTRRSCTGTPRRSGSPA